jgi:hypothetical protein
VLSEPRTINYLTEFIHLPVTHSSERLRRLYNNLCRSSGYENFIRTSDGARVESSRVEGSGVSAITFRRDRIQMVEENGVALEQFGDKIDAVARAAMETLSIPLFLAQQSTVRAISSPNAFKSSGEYLATGVFKVAPPDVEALGRPTSLVGFRMLFPATKDRPQKFNVRVETYFKDPRSLYIENIATFQAPVQSTGLDVLRQNVEAAAEFVAVNVCQFLNQYDRKDSTL